MRTWCYLIGLAQFPICNFLYSQFPIPALFWPCCGMRLFTELGFSKFNLRKVFPLNSLFKFLHNGKYDNQDFPQCTHFQWKSVLLFFRKLAFQPKVHHEFITIVHEMLISLCQGQAPFGFVCGNFNTFRMTRFYILGKNLSILLQITSQD